MVKTVSELYGEIRHALLAEEEPERAGMLAREIAKKATGLPVEKLLADGGQYVQDGCIQAAMDMTRRVCAGEPLAYVLGQWDFYGITLEVDRRVLIPRDDTCAVTALAVEQGLFLADKPRILDLCTGSGCIGIAIAHRIRDARVVLADLSEEALAVAKRNVAACKLGGRVSCVKADAMKEAAGFLGKFDMIVSNPPYVTAAEMERLPESVKDYEPHMALFGGEDGLDFYRSICKNYRKVLKPKGYLCLEFGRGQGDAVCALLEENGFTVRQRAKDYQEIERAVIAQYTREDKEDGIEKDCI